MWGSSEVGFVERLPTWTCCGALRHWRNTSLVYTHSTLNAVIRPQANGSLDILLFYPCWKRADFFCVFYKNEFYKIYPSRLENPTLCLSIVSRYYKRKQIASLKTEFFEIHYSATISKYIIRWKIHFHCLNFSVTLILLTIFTFLFMSPFSDESALWRKREVKNKLR